MALAFVFPWLSPLRDAWQFLCGSKGCLANLAAAGIRWSIQLKTGIGDAGQTPKLRFGGRSEFPGFYARLALPSCSLSKGPHQIEITGDWLQRLFEPVPLDTSKLFLSISCTGSEEILSCLNQKMFSFVTNIELDWRLQSPACMTHIVACSKTLRELMIPPGHLPQFHDLGIQFTSLISLRCKYAFEVEEDDRQEEGSSHRPNYWKDLTSLQHVFPKLTSFDIECGKRCLKRLPALLKHLRDKLNDLRLYLFTNSMYFEVQDAVHPVTFPLNKFGQLQRVQMRVRSNLLRASLSALPQLRRLGTLEFTDEYDASGLTDDLQDFVALNSAARLEELAVQVVGDDLSFVSLLEWLAQTQSRQHMRLKMLRLCILAHEENAIQSSYIQRFDDLIAVGSVASISISIECDGGYTQEEAFSCGVWPRSLIRWVQHAQSSIFIDTSVESLFDEGPQTTPMLHDVLRESDRLLKSETPPAELNASGEEEDKEQLQIEQQQQQEEAYSQQGFEDEMESLD